ncbi:STAS domain-containing protein [Geomonas sp. RF6]|uniref:STAS domain-containing protein n=1 Tax=Geomonas sp. RF6 TaxID=2897342 RepID=UPI001E3DC2FF|nr:STAS domain-containing protein [Geomonas sp. RF6]UFS71326.1 STAS domain-containing protein [Geomonas sp. RF6]
MAEMTVGRASGKGEGVLEITVQGPVTIAEAARFKEVLVEALGAADEVVVDLRGVTGMDLTSLQLLCAAHGSALAAQKSLTVAPAGNEVYVKVVEEAGFQCHVGCQREAKSCIWTGGKC